ncbi:MAG: hypothetical protein WDM76_15310 [Limisphaerales bacterium]
MFALTRAGFIDRLGMENICGDMDASLARAREILGKSDNKEKNKLPVDSKGNL